MERRIALGTTPYKLPSSADRLSSLEEVTQITCRLPIGTLEFTPQHSHDCSKGQGCCVGSAQIASDFSLVDD